MCTGVVPFEWDPQKAAANVRKHGVQISEASGGFGDGYAITIRDDESDPDEQRFVTIGAGIKGRILVAQGPNANSTRHNDEGYVRLQQG